MSDLPTTPEISASLPLKALKVEVLEGPNAGKTATTGSDTLSVGTAERNTLVLTDATVSRYHVECQARPSGALVIDTRSTNGTWVGAVRIERAVVPAGTSIRIGRTTVRISDGEMVEVPLHSAPELAGLHGCSAPMRRLMAEVERAARSDAAVLVQGDSGTGKELVARALHSLGPRSTKPFVTVDCGALSPTLVSSELFGHERGAFTGADRQHIGSFERADGGTVFLDEIGELPPSLQATLLGVLERKRFRRLGGQEDIQVDVRCVSATNRDLRAEVNQGQFRLDLYYRIAVLMLKAPPLHERPDDIPLLVEFFAREAGFSEPLEALFPPATVDALCAHPWPGNVRELRNVVEAAIALGNAPALAQSPLPPLDEKDRANVIAKSLEVPFSAGRGRVVEEFERRYLVRLLERAANNVSAAARLAQMNRSHLIALLHKHGIR